MKKIKFEDYFAQKNTNNIIMTSFLSLGAIGVSIAYSPLSFLAWMMPGVLASELMTRYRIKKNFFNPIVGSFIQRSYFKNFDKKINEYLNVENPIEKRAKIIFIHMYLQSNKYDANLFLDNNSHFFKHIVDTDSVLKESSTLLLQDLYLKKNDIGYIDFWKEDAKYQDIWIKAYDDFKTFGLLGKNAHHPILDIFSILIELQKGSLSQADIESIYILNKDYDEGSESTKKYYNLFSVVDDRPNLKDNYLQLLQEKLIYVSQNSSLENTKIYFNFIKKIDHSHYIEQFLDTLIINQTLEKNLNSKKSKLKISKL